MYLQGVSWYIEWSMFHLRIRIKEHVRITRRKKDKDSLTLLGWGLL